jgi:hypothetical protein
MLAVRNAIPLILLGVIAGCFMLVFIYHVWSKKFRRPPVVDVETGSINDSESDNRSDRTLRKSRKKGMPKMWDVRIPKLGRPRHEQEDEVEDDIEEKDAGKWDTIKPMSVAYIKNTPTSASAPPDSDWSVIPGPHVEPTTPTTLAHCNLSVQQLDESSGRRPAYDKATIEAVQVSVLISMPTKPGVAKTKAPMAGPKLEVGVVKIALDDDKKWKRRTGRSVAYGFAI